MGWGSGVFDWLQLASRDLAISHPTECDLTIPKETHQLHRLRSCLCYNDLFETNIDAKCSGPCEHPCNDAHAWTTSFSAAHP